MAQILCSTGALLGRPNGRNYRLLEDFSKQLNCDGFELMVYSDWYKDIDALISYINSLKLNIPVVHCEKKIGELVSVGGHDNVLEALRRFKMDCKIAKSVGATKIVIHLWGGIPSDCTFENNINTYPELLTVARNNGLMLLVENVVCNQQDPMSRWLQLIELYPDIKLILDTKMFAFHNQLDLIYKPEYAFLYKNHHINHYHINDYAGGFKDWANLRTLPIGKGNVDFKRFFDHINAIGYNDTFTVEATAFNSEGIVDIEMLNNQFNIIRKSL